jgi:catechol-2,3-dioxygenase
MADAQPIPSMGHAVINVRHIGTSLAFYEKLGLRVRRRSRMNGVLMVFLSFGERDHDLALRERGPAAAAYDRAGIGLAHLAFRIGDRLEQLRAFKRGLDARHVEINRMTEHRNSNSIYLRDPDGIEVEFYVDSAPPVWSSEVEIEVRNPSLILD